MKRIRLLSVGRIKAPYWKTAADHYRDRLSRFLHLEEVEVKDADASLPVADRMQWEAERLAAKARPTDTLLCLDAAGTAFTSEVFARRIQALFDSGKRPCFVIGGAYGLAPSILQRADLRLSLSPLTFTHETARVLLLEQLYRAENILAGTGYHH